MVEKSGLKLDLNTNIGFISGIGSKLIKKLEKLGIRKIYNLLFYFPSRYDDFSRILPISEIREDEGVVQGRIVEIKNKRLRHFRFITLAKIADKSGICEAIWYNQPYLTTSFKSGDEVVLAGRVRKEKGKIIFQNPVYEKLGSLSLPGMGERLKTKEELVHVGRIVPVYHETSGLTSKWIRTKIKELLPLVDNLRDYLPKAIKASQKLLDLNQAISQIHFPQNRKLLKEAKKRLSFDELFLIQLNFLKQKIDWQKNIAPAIKFKKDLIKKFIGSLSFKLTSDQKKAAWEILLDLKKNHPMNRLLEGEVGSGKTIVACLAILNVVKNGYQAVLMCPTEILARQHFDKVKEILKPFGVRIEFLVGSTKTSLKKGIYQALSEGEIDLIIGTHSLIQEKISFKNLGLAIIDEQHRFGVAQRAEIRKKNQSHLSPHLLSMTATPIPRSLALALYGDLDLSIIAEMPPGRQKVITKFIGPEKRKKAYDFIRNQVISGRQCFVICPLIEESDKLGVKAATSEYEKLQKEVFPDLIISMLHGKMKTSLKEKIMSEFQNGKIDILVSTPVVEVGIDIPNATIILIEGAERFGLAQLHQFRGRVGRGKYQSYCFLFTESGSPKTFARLKAVIESKDGFELAEKDLEIRGPGEIYGLRQHGIPDLKMASLTDVELIKKAKLEALKILKLNPKLENYPLLISELRKFQITRHLE